jgi:hypothetical protein
MIAHASVSSTLCNDKLNRRNVAFSCARMRARSLDCDEQHPRSIMCRGRVRVGSAVPRACLVMRKGKAIRSAGMVGAKIGDSRNETT